VKIAYGKIGRSVTLDRRSISTLGGDVDVLNLLERLACARPDDEIIFVTRNSGEDPSSVGLPSNVKNVWHGADADGVRAEMLKHKQVREKMWLTYEFVGPHFISADAVVMWVGQHGTSNIPIPNVGTDWKDDVLTNPQDSFLNYVGSFHMGINAWRDKCDGRREESWLLPDVRNYFKGRDLKWPLRETMLAQYNKTHQAKFERWGDARDPGPLGFDAEWEHSCWVTQVTQAYAGVELTAITDPAHGVQWDLDGRAPFGMLVNENAKERKPTRLDVLCEWVLPNFPDAQLYGTWSEQSTKIMRRPITPLPHHEAMERMAQWRCTFTTPASGSGWATAKPWEAFLTNTVCFFHPRYDDQDHILSDADPDLKRWLRPPTPAALKIAVDTVNRDDDVYEWLVNAQRAHLYRRFTQDLIGNTLRVRIEAQAKVDSGG
jgi:hypothetical protein